SLATGLFVLAGGGGIRCVVSSSLILGTVLFRPPGLFGRVHVGRVGAMIYRRAGISFTRYQDERQLWKLPTDRWAVIVIFALLLVAPFLVDRLFVVGYLLPLIIWSMAAMGLNLLMGGAGQIHLGYGAVIGIGAYASVHAMRAGLPFELAMIVGGLASAVIGVVFGAAALRV